MHYPARHVMPGANLVEKLQCQRHGTATLLNWLFQELQWRQIGGRMTYILIRANENHSWDSGPFGIMVSDAFKTLGLSRLSMAFDSKYGFLTR